MKPLSPSLPHIIAMVGCMSSRKTQFAVNFAKIFNSQWWWSSPTIWSFYGQYKNHISDATLSLWKNFWRLSKLFWTDRPISARIVCVSIALPGIWISLFGTGANRSRHSQTSLDKDLRRKWWIFQATIELLSAAQRRNLTLWLAVSTP